MMNEKKYVEKLFENDNRIIKRKAKLQLNLEIEQEELKNLKDLLSKLKRSGIKTSIKEICYGALKDSGIFDEINK